MSFYHNNSPFTFFGPMDLGVLVAVTVLMYILSECQASSPLVRALDPSPAEDTATP